MSLNCPEVMPGNEIKLLDQWQIPPEEDLEIIYPDTEYLNMLGQQRDGNNPRQAELTASIASQKVLNPINVAILNGETFQSYLDFTNKIWAKDHKLEDLKPVADDLYILVIAGHSRVTAIKTLRENHPEGKQKPLPAQVHEVDSIDDIIAIQLAENIHSAPPPDRAARAYAEAFLWQNSQGQSISRKAFAAQNGITTERLKNALLYAELPEEIRELTTSQLVPFSISVELAKAYPWIALDESKRLAESDTMPTQQHQEAAIKEFTVYEMARFITQYNGRLNRQVTKTRSIIQQHTEALKKKHSDNMETDDLVMSLFDTRSFDNPRDKIVKDLAFLRDQRAEKERSLHNRIVALIDAEGLEINDETERLLRDLASTAIGAPGSTDKPLFAVS